MLLLFKYNILQNKLIKLIKNTPKFRLNFFDIKRLHRIPYSEKKFFLDIFNLE